MWFRNRKKDTEKGSEIKDREFKPFHETYKIVSFNMSTGVLYPNPATEKLRLAIILITYLSVTPVSVILFIDVYNYWLCRDIVNIIRHFTILIPFLLVLTKMYLMYRKRAEAKQIIDEINRDHELYNELPETYKIIIREDLKDHKLNELIWAIVVMHAVMVFPTMAAFLSLYSYTFTSEPRRYMVHDLNLPSLEPEDRFKTPYYESMFVYMLYCCAIYFVNFVGYDGFFGIAINHACLKMKLYCKCLEDALKEERREDVYKGMVKVIGDQCRVYRLVETIQETFNFWLGMIFTGTVVHVCNCMYQIMEGFGFDLTYSIFIVSSVVHIYLPCRSASKLQSMSAETSTLVYSSGWEHVYDQRIRKMIVFMIARAQIPTNITAFNILTFDMELFVSILHTSYSMFTLLRS